MCNLGQHLFDGGFPHVIRDVKKYPSHDGWPDIEKELFHVPSIDECKLFALRHIKELRTFTVGDLRLDQDAVHDVYGLRLKSHRLDTVAIHSDRRRRKVTFKRKVRPTKRVIRPKEREVLMILVDGGHKHAVPRQALFTVDYVLV